MSNSPDPVWASVVDALSKPYGTAYFATADGHLVKAEVRQERMSLRIWMFIDGWWKGEWTRTAKCEADLPALPRRFLRTSATYAFPAKDRTAAARKRFKLAGLDWDVDAKIYQTGLPWGCPKRCVAHLRRANPGIRVLTFDESVALSSLTPGGEGSAAP